MLSKDRRIPRREFPSIIAHGRRLHTPHFILYILPLPTPAPSRFSFSVSKKVFKHATDRNTYRRRGYAAISHILSGIAHGYLFFFSYKKGEYPIPFAVLAKEIHHILKTSSFF